jgi:hypothetical protein
MTLNLIKSIFGAKLLTKESVSFVFNFVRSSDRTNLHSLWIPAWCLVQVRDAGHQYGTGLTTGVGTAVKMIPDCVWSLKPYSGHHYTTQLFYWLYTLMKLNYLLKNIMSLFWKVYVSRN